MKSKMFVVANLMVGIVGFDFAWTKTKAKSVNDKQFSKDKMHTNSDMQAV